ncbi:MAG: leucine--tRNA ligase [Candidatus Woesearchaeota archaeon]
MTESAEFLDIEKKWQKKWDDSKVFKADDNSSKKKFYCLEMFPYPSGSGLHMGHALNYTIGDVYARFKRMTGHNVLYPMGYDAFGLPAENAAIKVGEHPDDYTKNSISNFIMQQKALGLSYDWLRVLKTCDPSYYRWDQWIFLKMFEKGLAFRKKSSVNWCPKCNTVLANEQVHDGKCWRHEDTNVDIKHLEQWFLKITDYADELYEKIDTLTNWPNVIKAMQKNWIGKSFGTEIKFKINGDDWPIFTTRPDTIFGVTFMVISAQHSRLNELVTTEQKEEVELFLKKIKSTSEKDLEELEKEGAFTGSYAINPITSDKVPVYAGNFVLADYGSGMVMAVPAHDQRDFEFAKKYNIPIKVVISPKSYTLNSEKMSRAFVDEGFLIDSNQFDGTSNKEAIDEITSFLEKKGHGKKTVNFKLRDWLVSRQRYWGTPIPIFYCDKCGIVPVPESELPIKLPHDVKFGEGNPLLTNSDFVNSKCPKCGHSAKRETDTMDTFVNSSWYFLRYTDSKNDKEIFDVNNAKYWAPIDTYIGGKEHACMHLIYFRFYTKFLRDLGLIDFDEPCNKLFNQGMLHGADGNKMSKSLGNVVNPIDMIEKFGADSLRFNLMSLSSPDKDSVWNDRGIESTFKFIRRFYDFFDKVKIGNSSARLESKLHKAIRDVSIDIENFKYNLAIIKIRQLSEVFEEEGEATPDNLLSLIKLIHPFCPHLTEELFEKMKFGKIGAHEFLSLQSWPVYDELKIDERAESIEDMIKGTKSDILKVLELAKIVTPKKITLFVSEDWKYLFFEKFVSKIKETRDFKEIVSVMMSDDNIKRNSSEIMKLIPALLKDNSKIPNVVLDSKTECDSLNVAASEISKQFNCIVEVFFATGHVHPKAKQANPGKPAILVE